MASAERRAQRASGERSQVDPGFAWIGTLMASAERRAQRASGERSQVDPGFAWIGTLKT